MPIFVRARNGGKSYELRVKHTRLPKPLYLTLDSEAEARRAGDLALAALERGEMPAWLRGTKESPYDTIADAVRAYQRGGKVATMAFPRFSGHRDKAHDDLGGVEWDGAGSLESSSSRRSSW